MPRANSSQRKNLNVYSDMRWPLKTGIGNVMAAMIERKPSRMDLIGLEVKGSIGSPFSPFAISHALRRSGADRDGVYWSAGFVPPALMNMPSVVTVHDLTHLRFYSRFHAAYYNHYLKPLYRRCSAIVCVSDYTRREFLDWSGMPPDKVSVVYNSVDQMYLDNQEAAQLSYRYVLYPGNHRSYKNLERLISAFAASALPQQNIHLVMTGAVNQSLVEHAMRQGVVSKLHFLGRVKDEDLPKLYKGALLVAFVSLYEGFGLPIVEAMASGVPVLTSDVSAMPEVAGNAALIVDPYSIDAIAEGLNDLVSDEVLRQELVGKGREQVKRFDWDRSAKKLWDIVGHVYESA
ncbi:MAG: glycosyltransferase family 1 protein [Pseudomonadota bacterium]